MTQAIADNATVLREFKHLALVFWHEFNNFKQVIVVINFTFLNLPSYIGV